MVHEGIAAAIVPTATNGLTPRYSPTTSVGRILVMFAVKSPSTSDSFSPASARASFTASPSKSRWVYPGAALDPREAYFADKAAAPRREGLLAIRRLPFA